MPCDCPPPPSLVNLHAAAQLARPVLSRIVSALDSHPWLRDRARRAITALDHAMIDADQHYPASDFYSDSSPSRPCPMCRNVEADRNTCPECLGSGII